MKSTFNLNLESIRGFAALFVIISHLANSRLAFNPTYNPNALIVLQPSGHLSVLLFFILSGYVISVSHKEQLSSENTLIYLKKRFIRIYPIYCISLIFTLLIAINPYSLYQIICNFTLTHVLLSPGFTENSPSWSINYEVLYYLLFIPISFFNLKPVTILVTAVVLAFTNYYFYPNTETPIISSYLFGLAFWISGMCLTKYFKPSDKTVSSNILLSMLFLFLAIDQLVENSGINEFVKGVSISLFNSHLLYPKGLYFAKTSISYKDLALLPYCFYIIMIFADRTFKHRKLFFVLLQIPLIFSIGYNTWQYTALHNRPHFMLYLISVFYYGISLILFFANTEAINSIGKRIINAGIWLGGISYALYIIHMPLLYAFGKLPFLHGAGIKYGIKVFLFFTVTIAASYVLEKIFQPWVKGAFFSKSKKLHAVEKTVS